MNDEIKVGDIVERTPDTKQHTGSTYHGGKVGSRYKVTDCYRGFLDAVPHGRDGRAVRGEYTALFKRVPAERPVYPYKAGDVVVCKDARAIQRLTEGKSYTVRRVHEDTSSIDLIQVTGDDDVPFSFQATRFCAPDEYAPKPASLEVLADYSRKLADENARAVKAEREYADAILRLTSIEDKCRSLENLLKRANANNETMLKQREALLAALRTTCV